MLPLFLRLGLSGRLNDHVFVGRDIGIYGMIVKKRFVLRKPRRVFRDVVCAARILIARSQGHPNCIDPALSSG